MPALVLVKSSKHHLVPFRLWCELLASKSQWALAGAITGSICSWGLWCCACFTMTVIINPLLVWPIMDLLLPLLTFQIGDEVSTKFQSELIFNKHFGLSWVDQPSKPQKQYRQVRPDLSLFGVLQDLHLKQSRDPFQVSELGRDSLTWKCIILLLPSWQRSSEHLALSRSARRSRKSLPAPGEQLGRESTIPLTMYNWCQWAKWKCPAI